MNLSRGRNFALGHHVQTSSGALLASYPVGTWAISPGIKLSKHESDHSLASNSEVKNA
jgi:hypothetical protein